VGISVPVSPGCALFRKNIVEKYLLIDIDNDIGLEFSRLGAGNDLMLFLGACIEFDNFYYIHEMLATFYGGNDSITVTNNLDIFYSYTIYSFLKKYKDKYRILWDRYMTRAVMDKRYDFIRREKNFNFDVLYWMRRLMIKMFRLNRKKTDYKMHGIKNF
jgi:hypothetical protein